MLRGWWPLYFRLTIRIRPLEGSVCSWHMVMTVC